MSGKFQPINRDTAYLLPPSLQDWLPEKHLARFVVDIVDQLDLGGLVKRYGGGGKQPYHPAVLLALLFYGYATGIFSSIGNGIAPRRGRIYGCMTPIIGQQTAPKTV